MARNVLLAALFFLFHFFLEGQETDLPARPIFSCGIITSKVNGDAYNSYEKIGYYLGVGMNKQISKLYEVEYALTFLQKGERHNYSLSAKALNNPSNPFYLSRLNYLEIPVVLKINYKKIKFETGAALGYLVKNPPTILTNNPIVVDYTYNKFDISYIIGLGKMLSSSWLINLRFEYSLLPTRPYYASSTGIYHGLFPFSLFNQGLYNNLLLLSLNYKLPTKTK